MVFFNSALLGQTISEFMASDLVDTANIAESYLKDESLLSLSRIRTYLILFVFPVAMLFVFRWDNINIRYRSAIMFYAVAVIVGEFVSILFRLQQYVIVFSWLFYVESFIYLASWLTLNRRRIVALLLMLLLVYVYIGAYFNKLGDTGHKSYERYFPYTSIFYKEDAPYRGDMR